MENDQQQIDDLFAAISPTERERLLVLFKSKWVEFIEPPPMIRKNGRGDGPGIDGEKRTTHAVAGR